MFEQFHYTLKVQLVSMTKRKCSEAMANISPSSQFLKEVIDQPTYLRKALDAYPAQIGEYLHHQYLAQKFSRVLLVGHGASYNSLYPAFLQLNSHSISATLWHTAELIHYAINQVDEQTLLLLNSQSGQSAEIVGLISKLGERPHGPIVSLTNDPNSIIGKRSDYLINLNGGEEFGLATKTYFNALGLSILLSKQICGEMISDAIDKMHLAAVEIDVYLKDWQKILIEIDAKIGNNNKIMTVGRGPSMASALTGALNQKEAAWLFTEGMNAGEFRHGPIELASSEMTLVILEGDPATSNLNTTLADDVTRYGGHILWIGNHPPESIASIQIPNVPKIALPLAEIIPLQLLAYVLAARQQLEPGNFRHIGKIVLHE